jgi:hypothetical protein
MLAQIMLLTFPMEKLPDGCPAGCPGGDAMGLDPLGGTTAPSVCRVIDELSLLFGIWAAGETLRH